MEVVQRKISSRLLLPVLPEVVWRHALFNQLQQAFARNQAIWLSAPPGSGKTTLAASYVQYHQLPSLWYQLNPNDSDPAAFFHYLATAAKAVIDDKAELLPTFSAEYAPGLAAFTRRFFETLYEYLPTGCVIVFDNYHELEEQSALHDILPLLLENIPPELTAIVISREPPVRQLARLRANQALIELGWDAIQFNDDESAQMLALKNIIEPTKVSEMVSSCKGWAAGLVLMNETGGPGISSDTIADNHQLLFDYFAQETISTLAAQSLEALYAASLFPRFSANMLAQLTGTDVKPIEDNLLALYQRRFFTYSTEANGERYFQFHPLFSYYLQSQLKQHHGDDIAELTHRASQIAFAEGHPETAAELAIDIQDWAQLSAICLDIAEDYLSQGRHRALLTWLQQIPTQQLERQAWLSLWYANALLPLQPSAVEEHFTRAYQLFIRENNIQGRYLCWASAVEAMNFSWQGFGRADYWIGELNQLLKEADYPSTDIECRMQLALLTLLLWVKGGIQDFPNIISHCEALIEKTDNPNVMAGLVGCVMQYHWSVSGNMLVAGELVDQYHRRICDNDSINPFRKLYWYGQYVFYCYFTGQYNEGLLTISQAMQIQQKTGVNLLEIVFQSFLAMAYTVRGDFANADNMLRTIRNKSKLSNPIEHSFYLFVHANRYFREGDIALSEQTLLKALALTEKAGIHGNTYAQTIIFLAMVYLEQGRDNDYEDRLRQIESRVQRTDNTVHRFQVLLLNALCQFYRGNGEALKTALGDAFTFAKENKIAGILGHTPQINNLFALALKYGIETQYISALAQKLQLDLSSPQEPQPRWLARIRTLGRFSIETIAGEQTISTRQKRESQLLSLLVTERNTVVPRERIKTLLWPESDDDKAEQNLKSTLARLKKRLGNGAIVSRRGGLLLDTNSIWVDCWNLTQILQSPNSSTQAAIDKTNTVLELYHGPFLETDVSPWVLLYRERLQSRLVATLLEHCQFLYQQHSFAEVINLCENAHRADPCNEGFYQWQIRALLALDRPTDAQQALRQCGKVLANHLKTLPSLETKKLLTALEPNLH